ncbi:MAG: redoxin domain-containing protein [Bradymonadia bacterium]
MSLLILAALKVAVIAGGDTPESNYNSHLTHVRQLTEALVERGVSPEDITVFWADGEDPKPDRAVRRRPDVKGAWIIEGSAVDAPTQIPLEIENTTLKGFTLHTASRASIQRWASTLGPTLSPDDTVLLAVTDHGVPDETYAGNTAVSLWGERWTVAHAAEDLASLSKAGRVVMWMSQCFSGGFDALPESLPNVCGAFSTTAERVAYGCYPDLATQDDIGHFMRLLDGLEGSGSLAAASDAALVLDDTPDVPHLTSDALLWRHLARTSEQTGVPLATFVDQNRSEPAPSTALIEEVSRAYGLGPLPTYAALSERLDALANMRDALLTWRDRWQEPLTMVQDDAVAPWSTRFLGGVKRGARRDQLRSLRRGAVALAQKTLKATPERWRSARIVHTRLKEADALWMHIEQQEAAALRVAYLMARDAGLTHLSDAERRDFERLRQCESSPLWSPRAVPNPNPASKTRNPPVPFETLRQRVDRLRPAFAGVRFDRKPHPEAPAALVIQGLDPDGPGQRAGMRTGDIILALGGAPLKYPESFLLPLMLQPPGVPLQVGLERDGTRLEVSLTPTVAPLPPPLLAVGDQVPELITTSVQGTPPELGQGRRVMLFFWATWCRPCKAALPTLQAWAREHDAVVWAIAQEPPETVSGFLKRFPQWPGFPVSVDPSGATFEQFQVLSTPTFIEVAPDGTLVDGGEGFDGVLPLKDEGSERGGLAP